MTRESERVPSRFFVIDRTRKQMLLITRFDFVFIEDLPSVNHSSERAVTVENE